jgi:hypothetical protein
MCKKLLCARSILPTVLLQGGDFLVTIVTALQANSILEFLLSGLIGGFFRGLSWTAPIFNANLQSGASSCRVCRHARLHV